MKTYYKLRFLNFITILLFVSITACAGLTAKDWFEKEDKALNEKKYKDAVEAYSKAIELDPEEAIAYINRGTAYSKLNNYKQAIKDYDKAIELDPKYAGAYYNRGTAYSHLGNYEKFIENLKFAARLGHKKAQDFLRSLRIEW